MGEDEVNESKLRNLTGAAALRQAEAHEVREITKAPVGFAGPVGLDIPVYADWDVMSVSDGVCGANEADKHFKNVNLERDFKVKTFGDVRVVKAGDLADDGSGALEITTTMEVGHIFKLGTRYTECLDALYLDEKGVQQKIIMGCYGIGVNRILAAAIEEHHDDKGIKWPQSIAPFDAALLTLNQADEKVCEAAEKLYTDLKEAGYDVLYDDRDERAGVKFKDADLIGLPLQIIIGERNLNEGLIEIKVRATGEAHKLALSDFTPASLKNFQTVPQPAAS